MPSEYEADSVAQHERDAWSRSAEVYPETFSHITPQSLPRILEEIDLFEQIEVLDIGCGPGDVTGRLATLGAQVVGIDFAGPMIEVASRRFPQLTFKQADVEELPFDDATFDLVIGNMVVHHFARPDVAFREICRVLKPGGTFAFIVPIPDTQTSFTAFSKALVEHINPEAVPSGPLYNIADESDYERRLSSAGFSSCRFDHPRIEYVLENLDPLLQGGWEMAGLASQSQEIQDNIRKDTIRYAEPYKVDGGYMFPDIMFLAVATRD